MFIEKTILSAFKPAGREVGSDAAVVSVGWSTSSALLSFLLGISMFTPIEISNAIGNNHPSQVGFLLWQIVYACILGSLLMIIAIPIIPFLLKFMSADGRNAQFLLEREDHYCTIVVSLSVLFLLYDVGCNFFASLNSTQPIIVINISCVFINAILDYVLIIIFQLGYLGAAVALVLTKFIGVILFAFTAFIPKRYRQQFAIFTLSAFKPDFRKILITLGSGFLVGAVNCLDNIAWTLVLLMCQSISEVSVTAMGYCTSISELFLTPSYAMASAVKIFV